jgi:hypothetical protein
MAKKRDLIRYPEEDAQTREDHAREEKPFSIG